MDIIYLTIITILWCLIALLIFEQWIGGIRETSWGLKIFIFLLIFVTAPFLLVNDIVVNFLDIVLPEGWQDGGNQTPKF